MGEVVSKRKKYMLERKGFTISGHLVVLPFILFSDVQVRWHGNPGDEGEDQGRQHPRGQAR